eukprot:Opistho-2@53645
MACASHRRRRVSATSALLLIVVVCATLHCASATWWPFASEQEQQSEGDATEDATEGGFHRGVERYQAPFELHNVDHTRQMEVELYLKGANGNACQLRILDGLRKSCSSMSEEEISKVGVNLFSCQSEMEGRPAFPCTADMTIAECTSPMDAATWNAYHIVSMRARDICLHLQSELFRLQTEATINGLRVSAASMVGSLSRLREVQEEAREAALEGIAELREGNTAIADKQRELAHRQGEIAVAVGSLHGMVEKSRELVEQAHQIIRDDGASIATDMRKGFGDAREQLSAHQKEAHDRHESLMTDIAALRSQADDVRSSLAEATSSIEAHRGESEEYFANTIGNLKKINATVELLLYIVALADSKLSLLSEDFGAASLQVDFAFMLVTYTVVCSVAGALMVFLRMPMGYRWSLLALFLVRIQLERHGVPVPMRAFIASIGALYAAFFYISVSRTVRPKPSTSSATGAATSSKSIRSHLSEDADCDHDCPSHSGYTDIKPAPKRIAVSKRFSVGSDDTCDMSSDIEGLGGLKEHASPRVGMATRSRSSTPSSIPSKGRISRRNVTV